LPQAVWPGPQQMPFVQDSPWAHALPQPPQLSGSVSGFEQTPLQLLLPFAQHFGFVPSERVVHVSRFAVHIVPHVPQLPSSVFTSTH
jgi:hypothetical protein